MPFVIGASMVVVVTIEVDVKVVEVLVVMTVAEREEVLDVHTRGSIGPPFSQETRLK